MNTLYKPVLLLVASIIIVLACNRIDFWNNNSKDINQLINNNKSKINISQGIAGTLIKKEGDCMPTFGIRSSCKSYPVKRKIGIYKYTLFTDLEGYGPIYDTVNTQLISVAETDNDGFFQCRLDSGKYSLFILDNDKFYANGGDDYGGINPVYVKNDSVSTTWLVLDYAVY